MLCRQLVFREHALLRMVAARRINRLKVEEVLGEHRIITEYPTDQPFPSRLLLGSVKDRHLHVVVAHDANECCFVITVYEPDPLIWNQDFSLKKKS